jgi:hypothetical protein
MMIALVAAGFLLTLAATVFAADPDSLSRPTRPRPTATTPT